MPKVIVTDRAGREHELQGKPDYTVMETIRLGGIDDLLALCGGVCSCATCHVFVDPAFAAAFPAVGEDEDALLDASPLRDARSRLACQLRLGPQHEGLKVTIADDE